MSRLTFSRLTFTSRATLRLCDTPSVAMADEIEAIIADLEQRTEQHDSSARQQIEKLVAAMEQDLTRVERGTLSPIAGAEGDRGVDSSVDDGFDDGFDGGFDDDDSRMVERGTLSPMRNPVADERTVPR